MALLEPKDLSLTDAKGVARTFVLSKFPAVAGREIVTQYPPSAAPKIGDYYRNEELMLKLMGFVGVRIEGRDEPIVLSTQALIDNHVGDFETLLRIEMAMMEYNCSFFANGKMSGLFDRLGTKLRELITQTLMDFSQQYKAKD